MKVTIEDDASKALRALVQFWVQENPEFPNKCHQKKEECIDNITSLIHRNYIQLVIVDANPLKGVSLQPNFELLMGDGETKH